MNERLFTLRGLVVFQIRMPVMISCDIAFTFVPKSGPSGIRSAEAKIISTDELFAELQLRLHSVADDS